MEGLSETQKKFLDDYAFDERSMNALLEDYEVTPAILCQWMQNEAFVKAKEEVDEFLSFARECNCRKAAMDYARRTRHGINGENRQLGVRQAREGRSMFDRARKLEPNLVRRRGPHKIIFVNPVHPAFANTALGLLERLESLQREAALERQKVKALPAPPASGDPPALAPAPLR
jgi:hypothetical protein